jgi:hypothetical protein
MTTNTGQDETAAGTAGVSGETTPEAKMVPESDLMAVKANLTQTVDDLGKVRAEVQRLTGLAQTHQEDATTAKARVAQLSPLETQIADSEKSLGAEKARADAAESALSKSQTDLLDLRKNHLTDQFGIEAAELEGKTLAELATYAEALALIPAGSNNGRSRFDGGGSGVQGEALTGRQSIVAGLDAGENLGPLR